MKNRVYELKNQRATLLLEAKAAQKAKDRAAFDAKMAEVAELNDEISQLEALQAEEGRFEDSDGRMVTLHDAQAQRRREEASLSRMDAARSGNEYARAFAHAIRVGANVESGNGDERLAPLYAALKETGGTPDGADGGFLVPIDFDNAINEERRALSPLAGIFRTEVVNTLTGWRVMDNAPAAGFTLVDEMEEIPQDDQPKFRKIEYAVKKYGLIVPISRELVDDNAAMLLAYLARWFAKKSVITENKLLLALLALVMPKAVTQGDEVREIKRALNVTLDPVISTGSTLITNQSGFSTLDELQGDNGYPLLQPDIQSDTEYRLLGRPVVSVPNRFLANAANTSPLYIGDAQQYATLFRRKAFELASTNIGGNAFRTDSIEVRGLMRLDARVFDKEAMTALTLPIS